MFGFLTLFPARETIKEVNESLQVIKTVDRKGLWLIQTPQVFHYEDIFAAHQTALKEGWEEATDDAYLIEKMGIPIHMIQGNEENIKVTTPYDLDLVDYFRKRKSSSFGRHEYVRKD